MNKGVSITLDLVLILVVLLVVLRGYGRSWLATLFTYNKVDLDLNPFGGLGKAIGDAIGGHMPDPGKGLGEAAGNIGGAIGGAWERLVPGGTGTPTSAGTHGGHPAVDIFAPAGTEIRAPVSGTSSPAYYSLGGYATILAGDDGRAYYFAHAQAPMAGGRVSAGQVIGRVGNTGNAVSTDSHLHFAVASSPDVFGRFNGSGDIWPTA
jgi:murein DD-endopeptidase MepM/ murein hydrolase activator NlpD